MIVHFLRQNIGLICLFICVVVTGGALMIVSQQVYNAQNGIHKKSKIIAEQEWELRTLKAEWAYLTRPDRIAQLADASSSNGVVAIVNIDSMPVVNASYVSNKTEYNQSVTIEPVVQKVSYGSIVPHSKPMQQKKRVNSSAKQNFFSSLLKILGTDE
jgi:cell division protein FtsL